MEQIVFKPKYEKKVFISIILMTLLGWLGLYFSFTSNNEDVKLFWISLFFSLIIIIFPFLFYKKIILGDNIVIERYFISKKVISYAEILDISFNSIITSQGKINLYPVANSGELIEILEKLEERGKFTKHQLAGELIIKEAIANKANLYSIPITIVLLIIGNFLSIYPDIDFIFNVLITWFFSFVITYYMLKLKTIKK